MAEARARNRVVFKRIVDGRTLNFVLNPDRSTTQVVSKDPKAFNPDFTQPASPLYITPVLTVSGGGGTNQVKGTCSWYVNGAKINSGQNGYTIETSGQYRLKLAANPTTPTTLIRCEDVYRAEDSGLQTTVSANLTLQQVENAGTVIMAAIDAPSLIFQTVNNEVKNLAFKGRMLRGATDDTTNVEYKWEITGVNGNFYPIIAATAPVGSGLPTGSLFGGVNTQTLTVNSKAVLNVATIRLTVKDVDASSSTYGKTAQAVVSVLDATDPFELNLDLPQGDSMSAGSAGLPLVFSLWQGGKEMSDAFYVGKTIRFWRCTEAGAKDATFAPSAADFAGWTVGNATTAGEISQNFAATKSAKANRTVMIKPAHLLEGQLTAFEAQAEFD